MVLVFLGSLLQAAPVQAADPLAITSIRGDLGKRITTSSNYEFHYTTGETIYLYIQFNQSVSCTPGGSFAVELYDWGDYWGAGREKAGEVSFKFSEMEDSSTAVFTYTVNTSLNGLMKPKAVEIPCSAGEETYTMSANEYWFHNEKMYPDLPNVRVVERYIDQEAPKLATLDLIDQSNRTKFKLGDSITIRPRFLEDLYYTYLSEDWVPSSDASMELNLMNNGSPVHMEHDGYDFKLTVREGDYASQLKVNEFHGIITDYAGNAWDDSGYSSDEFPIIVNYDQENIVPIIVDGSVPDSSVAGNAIDTYTQNPTEQISATDVGSGIASVEYEWSTSTSTPGSFTNNVSFAGNPNELNNQDILSPSDEDGTYYLHVRVKDVVGNTRMKYYGPYHIDNSAPTITASPEEGAGIDGPVTVSASDPAGVQEIQYQLNDGPWEKHTGSSVVVDIPANGDTYSLKVFATDVLGNVTSTQTYGPYTVDNTAPQPDFSYSEQGQPKRTHTVNIAITGNRADEKGSLYSLWSNSPTKPGPADGRWEQILTGVTLPASDNIATPEDEDGNWYLHIKTEDDLANVGVFTAGEDVDGGVSFLLDNTAPLLGFQPNGNNGVYANSETISLDVNDNISDLEQCLIKYLLLKEGESPGDYGSEDWLTSVDGTIKIEGMSGHIRVHVEVTDEAGNKSLSTSEPYAVDHLPPQGAVKFNNVHGHTNEKQVGVAFETEDNESSMEVRYAVEDEAWSTWLSYAQTKSKIFQLEDVITDDGVYQIHAQYRDEALNETERYTIDLTYDTGTPTVAEVTYAPMSYTNQPVTVTITYNDTFSPGTQSFQIEDNGVHSLTVYDQAGNSVTEDVYINNIDKTLPTIQFLTNGTTKNRQSVSAEVTASDNVSSALHIDMFYAWSASDDPLDEPQVWTDMKSGDEIALDSVDGEWFLWIRATDEAGNTRMSISSAFLMDNTKPIVTDVEYSPAHRTAMPVTARLTLSEPVYMTEPYQTDTLVTKGEVTLEDNGSVLFQFIDVAGNASTHTVTVDWIDHSLPTAQVSLSTDTWTNQPVDVTVSVEGEPPRALHQIQAPADAELVHIKTLEGDILLQPVADMTVTEAVYRLHTNGTIHFTIEDLDTGLTNDGQAQVTKIDLAAPTGEIRYSRDTWTQEDVTATLTVLDNSGLAPEVWSEGGSEVIFTTNGQHTFKFRDAAGNETELIAVVDWIARETPEPTITFNTTTWTYEPVTATISYDNETAPITINNHDSRTYTFDENGTFTFYYEDAAGNTGNSGPITVHWIDREKPTGVLTYSEQGWTNQDVTVTLQTFDNSGAEVTLLNPEGSQHTFTENGSLTFQLRDAAGNVNTVEGVVDRIDKTAPTASVRYSTTAPTNALVRATIEPNEPGVIIDNNNGSKVLDFNSNGSFTFDMIDRAGNTGSITATVGNIVRDGPGVEVVYSTTEVTNGNVIASVRSTDPEQDIYVINNFRRSNYVFTENGSFTFVVQDEAGNRVEATAVVTNIDNSKAEITVDYSETEPTRNEVTATIHSDRELTVINNNRSLVITFTHNAIRWVHAVDALGNDYWIELLVENIDQESPEVHYDKGAPLVIPAGDELDPLQGLRIMDDVDGDLTTAAHIQHEVDPTRAGVYEITYEVTDRAGNVLQFTRPVQVISLDQLSVTVNGDYPAYDGTALTVRGYDIYLDLFGERGNYTVKWEDAFVLKGYFKSNGDWLDSIEPVTVDQHGYYTFLIQDQQRQYRLVHVFVLPE